MKLRDWLLTELSAKLDSVLTNQGVIKMSIAQVKTQIEGMRTTVAKIFTEQQAASDKAQASLAELQAKIDELSANGNAEVAGLKEAADALQADLQTLDDRIPDPAEPVEPAPADGTSGQDPAQG